MLRRLPPLLLILPLVAFAAADEAGPAARVAGAERIVAFADVHGAHAELVSLLRATGIVDGNLRWSAGRTHLVSLGDLVDRGAESRQVLDLLMRLEAEAGAAGGAVHVVLGNHEVMNLAGDLRYVSEGEYRAFAGPEDDALREAAWQRLQARDPAVLRADFDARHPPGWFAHRQAFSPAGRYGAWLLGKPFVLVVNDTAFAHGGLPPVVARLGLEETNRQLGRQLADYLSAWAEIEETHGLAPGTPFQARPETVLDAGLAGEAEALRDAQSLEAFTTDGPTWYRGQALCHPFVETANLDAALARLGAKRLVVGHTVTPMRRVASRFDGRVILLDTGMLAHAYQGVAAAYVYEGGAWRVRYAALPDAPAEPQPIPRAVGPRPPGLDDDRLEDWLATAEIVGVEELDAGITQPQRVTLRKDGIELRAVLKQLSVTAGLPGSREALDVADRFQYEVAAYRLDRLLGLGLVPVTVPRTVNGRRGVLQFWVDGSINLRQMLEHGLVPEGWCEAEPQYNLMNVFDVLVHNTDRTQENALFTRDWNLVLIDHSRAFSTMTRPPRLLYQRPIELSPAFAAALASLDRAKLEAALGEFLHARQVGAILARRDRLLREHGPALPAAVGGN